MGDLSEHFNHKDFKCECEFCKGEEYRIHLGLVGVLEMITEHFKKKVQVGSGYWCDQYYDSLKRNRRTYHTTGKAAHIRVEDTPLNEVFKYIETIEGVNGIGFYPKENFIHLDTRPIEKKDIWVKEGENYFPLTPEKRKIYGL